jgi:hypothetical protein
MHHCSYNKKIIVATIERCEKRLDFKTDLNFKENLIFQEIYPIGRGGGRGTSFAA